MQKLLGLMRRCIDDYDMIREGDRIAVGVSGGKDSLVLLQLMAYLRKFFNKNYTLEAITIDMGLGMDYSGIAALCEKLEVPYHIIKTEIGPIIFEHRKEKNPCSLCSKMRRGALNQAILDLGFNKLALGHHYDDAVETFVMSLIYVPQNRDNTAESAKRRREVAGKGESDAAGMPIHQRDHVYCKSISFPENKGDEARVE